MEEVMLDINNGMSPEKAAKNGLKNILRRLHLGQVINKNKEVRTQVLPLI